MGVVKRSPTNDIAPPHTGLAGGPLDLPPPRASYGLSLDRAAVKLLGAAVNRPLSQRVKWHAVKFARGATRRHTLRTLRSTADAAATPRAASV